MYKKILIVLLCFIVYSFLRLSFVVGFFESIRIVFELSDESIMAFNLGYEVGYTAFGIFCFNMGLFFIIFIISIILTLIHKKLWYKKMRNTIFIIIGIEFVLALLYYYIVVNKFVSMHSSSYTTNEMKGIIRGCIIIPILIDGLLFWKLLHILKPKNIS